MSGEKKRSTPKRRAPHLPTLEEIDDLAAVARRDAEEIDRLETAAEDNRAVRLREQLERWHRFADLPWSAPETLSDAITTISNKPVIWLRDAVDMMAFGTATLPTDPVELGARRLQASRAISKAAQSKKLSLKGSPGAGGSDASPIPPDYFDFPRRLGSGENVVETDHDRISESVFDDAQSGRHKTWFDVRVVDSKKFIDWLRYSKPKNKGGRPAEFSWDPAYAHFKSLVDEYGKPGRENKRLPLQKDLIDLIVKFFADKDIHPERPTVKAKVSKWLKES